MNLVWVGRGGWAVGGAIARSPWGRRATLWALDAIWSALHNESSEESEDCPVDKNNPPKHPDFVPDKKKKDKQKIPWDKNKKGFKDKNGNYWEPVPDGHKGTHDPHWDVQKPDGTHTPINNRRYK